MYQNEDVTAGTIVLLLVTAGGAWLIVRVVHWIRLALRRMREWQRGGLL
jgi:hypothetical protein